MSLNEILYWALTQGIALEVVTDRKTGMPVVKAWLPAQPPKWRLVAIQPLSSYPVDDLYTALVELKGLSERGK